MSDRGRLRGRISSEEPFVRDRRTGRPDPHPGFIQLPDGKIIYPPKLHGEPIDRIACALLDMQQPGRSRFLRLTGPPGTGKSQVARCIAYRLWAERASTVHKLELLFGSLRQQLAATGLILDQLSCQQGLPHASSPHSAILLKTMA